MAHAARVNSDEYLPMPRRRDRAILDLKLSFCFLQNCGSHSTKHPAAGDATLPSNCPPFAQNQIAKGRPPRAVSPLLGCAPPPSYPRPTPTPPSAAPPTDFL